MAKAPVKVPDSVIDVINEGCENRESGDAVLNRSSPVYKHLVEHTNKFLNSKRSSGLTRKQKVLCLVAIHAMDGSEQSIEFAVTAAHQLGASEDELMDALELALLTGGGTAVSSAQFAINVWNFRKSDPRKKQNFDFAQAAEVSTPVS